MHPLSIFPKILFLGPMITPLLLRVAIGLFLMHLGNNRHKKDYGWTTFVYVLTGVLLVLGLYTQIAVLVGLIILGFDYFVDKKTTSLSDEKNILYMLVGIILFSLLFSGPGFLAFDLPI